MLMGRVPGIPCKRDGDAFFDANHRSGVCL